MEEEIKSTTVMTSYDPATGDITPTMEVDDNYIKDESNKHFNAFMGTQSVVDNIDKLKETLSGYNVSQVEELYQLSDLIKAKRNKEKITNPFQKLPTSIKNYIMANNPKNVVLSQEMLNMIASQVIDEITNQVNTEDIAMDLDTMLTGFESDMKKLEEDSLKESGKVLMSMDDERKAEIDEAIKKCKEVDGEDSEKVKSLESIKTSIDNAYNLDDFKEFCKHVRVKNYYFKKPSRCFDIFINKYENHDNSINSITDCPIVLDRHLGKKYTHDQNLKMCFGWCIYIQNMSPDNIVEHSFMYYFIKNILLLDKVNPKGQCYDSMDEKSKNFYDGFLKNIDECIYNINNQNKPN